MPVLRQFAVAPFLFVALLAQAPAPVVAAPVAAPAPAAAPTDPHGRLETIDGLHILHVTGTPAERGHAHGLLLAKEVAHLAIAEFTARFAKKQPLLELARSSVVRLVEYPPEFQQELDGLWQGLLDSKVDLRIEGFGRSFDHTDLLVANALDVFGLMGCSGFTAFGDAVDGGGVLTARNFDWPFTGPHLVDGTMLLVEHLPDGRAVASVTWPGYLGTVTGVSSEGLAAFLHVGTGKITMAPEPGSWPTAVAARAILEVGKRSDGAAVFGEAKKLLGNTSPPAGFLTRIVLPAVPAGGSPAGVFECDAKSCVMAEVPAGVCVTTNHFTTRKDGRPATKDSLDRTAKLQQGLEGLAGERGHKLTPADAWSMLESVQRGGKRHGTLHALVFRAEPWCFELRIADVGDQGVVAAPVGKRRWSLTKEQLFGPAPAAK